MIRESTQRLPLAAALSLGGALTAILAGQAEMALLVVPWVVLCILGLSESGSVDITTRVDVASDRLMVGDEANITTIVEASRNSRIKVTPMPASAFLSTPPGNEHATTPNPLPVIEALTAGEPAQIEHGMVAHEWGAHDIGQVAIEATMPFGLTRYRYQSTGRHVVRVHPKTTEISELVAPWLVRRVSGTHASPEAARGVEFADLREFGPGDSLRDINWRASARSTDLMVSQRQPDRASDVILLVDSFVESGHDVRAVFGSVVEATVALAEGHLGATDRVGLIEFGGLVRWVGPRTGRVQLHRLTDAVLATGLYENAADKELPILPARALPPRSFLIALTPLLDQRFIDAIFTARARGHDVAVVECVPEAPAGEAESDIDVIGRQLWETERTMQRDQMIGQGIAVGQWQQGEHLDIALGQLVRSRRNSRQVRQR